MMTDQQQYDLLLRQGVNAWNAWRKQHPKICPNLKGVDFRASDLKGANFSYTNLSYANLKVALLYSADLTRANLVRADLSYANLIRANLTRAGLSGADLTRADLREADLSGSLLYSANLSGANLREADLSKVAVEWTIFGNVDLRTVKGLETVTHRGPSTIGTDTISRSGGDIPETFLRGAGLSDTFITYARSLAQNPTEYYTCFISYSTRDREFANRLYSNLQAKGVRCWFAPEDMRIGEKFWPRIDESIRLYDKLLIILSKDSVNSVWVESEVMAALEKEQHNNKLVLFPIKLDEMVMETNLPWAANIRRTRHIGDFTNWKHYDDYQKALARLLRDLQTETLMVNALPCEQLFP